MSEESFGARHSRLEGVRALDDHLGRNGDAPFLERADESVMAFVRRSILSRAGDESDAPMAQSLQVVGGLRSGLAVVRDDHLRGVIESYGSEAHALTIDLPDDARECLVLRHGRKENHAVKLLALHESAHTRNVVFAEAVARVHDELEARPAQRVERTLLGVHDVLCVGVVIHQADQERPAKGESAGLRVRRVANALNDGIDLGTRLVSDERGLVDDSRDCLLGDIRQTRDVVDRRASAFGQFHGSAGGFSSRSPRALPPCAALDRACRFGLWHARSLGPL